MPSRKQLPVDELLDERRRAETVEHLRVVSGAVSTSPPRRATTAANT
ncbi:MAG: hypothetical protein R2695_04830 [Acidimicrobiales bacterium]